MGEDSRRQVAAMHEIGNTRLTPSVPSVRHPCTIEQQWGDTMRLTPLL
jgi:hypothetical protein